jgi:hypothetical protein
LGHSDQPSTSKSHDKERKADRCIANIEQLRHNKEYWPTSREFEHFLDQICIFHPHENHKTQDCDRLQGFADELLKIAKKANQEKNPEDPNCDFPEAQKEVNYIYGGLDSYESRRKKKLTAQEVLVVPPATLST